MRQCHQALLHAGLRHMQLGDISRLVVGMHPVLTQQNRLDPVLALEQWQAGKNQPGNTAAIGSPFQGDPIVQTPRTADRPAVRAASPVCGR